MSTHGAGVSVLNALNATRFRVDVPILRTFVFRRLQDGYLRGIHVVYSYEKTCAKLGELTDEQVAEPAAFGAVANFRLGTMPVLGHMPAIFGMMAAG